MIMLFSPSESKRSGGTGAFRESCDSLMGGWSIREGLAEAYEQVLNEGSVEERKTLVGWEDEEKIDALPKRLLEAPVLPAIDRYDGVGYQYLDVGSLAEGDRAYLVERLVIFSNLLGPVRGGEMIPETKLKQRAVFNGVNVAKWYRERTSEVLNELIGEQPVLDLRAGAYKSFYVPRGQIIECAFLKGGRSVNHWSKAYRGLVARRFAQVRPETVGEVIEMEIEGLRQIEVDRGGEKVVITYEAID